MSSPPRPRHLGLTASLAAVAVAAAPTAPPVAMAMQVLKAVVKAMAAARPLRCGPMRLQQRRRLLWRSLWLKKPSWRRWHRRSISSRRCPQAAPGGAGLPRPDQRRRESRCQRRINNESARRSNGVASLLLICAGWMVTRSRLPFSTAAGSSAALLIAAADDFCLDSGAGSWRSSGIGVGVGCGSA